MRARFQPPVWCRPDVPGPKLCCLQGPGCGRFPARCCPDASVGPMSGVQLQAAPTRAASHQHGDCGQVTLCSKPRQAGMVVQRPLQWLVRIQEDQALSAQCGEPGPAPAHPALWALRAGVQGRRAAVLCMMGEMAPGSGVGLGRESPGRFIASVPRRPIPESGCPRGRPSLG